MIHRHEFENVSRPMVVLIHSSGVMRDFAYVTPYLEGNYHVVIPVLPDYDEEMLEDFTSVEELEDWFGTC